MTDLRKAAQQALNALSCLEYGFCGITEGPSEDTTEAVITALRAALATVPSDCPDSRQPKPPKASAAGHGMAWPGLARSSQTGNGGQQ
jgi:hypothetical protein